MARHLPGAAEALDIDHAGEHLADASEALFGEGTEAAEAWLEASRSRPLSDGWWGRCERIGEVLVADRSARRRRRWMS